MPHGLFISRWAFFLKTPVAQSGVPVSENDTLVAQNCGQANNLVVR